MSRAERMARGPGESPVEQLTALLRSEIDDEGSGFGWDFYIDEDRKALAERLTKTLLEHGDMVRRVLSEAPLR